MRMSFSVGLGQRTGIHEVAGLARIAEKAGYSQMNFPDMPAFNRDVQVMMTIAALNTHRIQIGQGVTDPVTLHPSVIANGAATVDELSGGRAYVGLGAGGRYGKAMEPIGNRELREAVEFLKTYSSGQEASWKGARMHSEWIRRPLRVYIAAEGPRACRLAGEVADGIIFLGVHPEHVRWRMELLDQGARRAGRDISEIDVCVRGVVYPAASREEALRDIRPFPAGFEYIHTVLTSPTPATAELARRLERADPGITEAIARDYRAYDARRRQDPTVNWAEVASDRSLDFFNLAGTPEEIAERIEGLGRLGVTNISAMLYTIREKGELMELVSETIMPYFRN